MTIAGSAGGLDTTAHGQPRWPSDYMEGLGVAHAMDRLTAVVAGLSGRT
jgi:hypothetical protein